jgi:hypothetical protein
MTTDEELRIVAAKYVLDAIPSWELSALANRLVDDRLASRAVIDLATLREPTMAEAGPLFERILEAAHVSAPSGAYYSYDDIDDAERQSLDADVVRRAQVWITRHACNP